MIYIKRVTKYALPFLILCSCSKDEGKKDFMLSGHLYQDCGKTPVANAKLEIKERVEQINGFDLNQIATCTTGANGEYMFKGKYTKFNDGITISYNGGGFSQKILEYVPIKNSSLDLYHTRNSFVKIMLNTSRVFTEHDTLYYGIQHHSVSKAYKIGPLANGFFDYAKIMLQPNYLELINSNVAWGVGIKDYLKSIVSGKDGNSAYHLTPFSGTLCDTTVVEINIP